MAAGTWQQLLDAACEASGTPGAVVGVWHRGEQTVLTHGVLSTRTGQPVTPDAVFQIGSVTKTWTATMVAQLVAEGGLSLGTTVAEVLPGVRLGGVDQAPLVTVGHLLTHSSGLDGDVFTDTGRGDDCVRRYVELLGDVATVHPLGSGYSYCNTGFVLLGRIVEVLDGRTWDESLRARIVEPLGLADVCTLPEEALLRPATVGHDDGTPVPVWGLPRSLGPAGLVCTTAADLLTYARQWLGDAVPAHLAAMTEPRLGVPEGNDVESVGLGWRVGSWDGHRVIGHSGGTIGQSAQLRVVPALDLAVCVLANSPKVDALFHAVVPVVVSDLTGVAVPPPPEPAAGPAPGGVRRHCGTYERRAMRFEVEPEDDGLSVVLTPIGELGGLGEPERVRLHHVDATGDRWVARSEDADPWSSFAFDSLPDGTPVLMFVGRVAAKVAA